MFLVGSINCKAVMWCNISFIDNRDAQYFVAYHNLSQVMIGQDSEYRLEVWPNGRGFGGGYHRVPAAAMKLSFTITFWHPNTEITFRAVNETSMTLDGTVVQQTVLHSYRVPGSIIRLLSFLSFTP